MSYPGSGTYPGSATWPGLFGAEQGGPTYFSGSPARLAVTVTHANGTVSRWGFDEDDPRNIPTAITFSTSVPGGFKTAQLSLPRPVDGHYPDLNLYDSITIYGPGREVVWEGRVAQLPRQHDTSYSIQVGAIGWAAHLTDDPSFSMIYIDRDLSQWRGMSRSRRVNYLSSGAGQRLGDPTLESDVSNGLPALAQRLAGPWAGFGVAEAWYDAGSGNRIEGVYSDWQRGAAGFNGSNPNWEWRILSASDDTESPSDSGDMTGNMAGTGPDADFSTGSPRRYVYAYLRYSGDVTDDTEYPLHWRALVVYGNHGLTLRNPYPGGYYASDVIAHILSRAAPKLNYTTGEDGSIQPTSFVIPQLAFREPTTAEAAITLVNGYHLWEWGVWENRVFFYRAPDASRLTWEARRSDGAGIRLEGDDANNVFNGVVVQYTDAVGDKHVVGPPGSGHEATDAALLSTDEDNPLNAWNLSRWGLLNISQPTTLSAATQLGSIWLREHSLPQRRGTLTLKGHVRHPTKGPRPIAEVRAGDWIRLSDRPGDVARRIIETTYSHDSQSMTCSLDNTTFKLDAILERLGVSLVGVL